MKLAFFRALRELNASTISGNCAALSMPFREKSATASPSTNARTRMPSYFGSNTQSSPTGSDDPTDASIGVSSAGGVGVVLALAARAVRLFARDGVRFDLHCS